MAADKKNEDELLSRLQDTLINLETDEIVQGMTKDDLSNQGFIGNKKIEISRPWIKQGTEKENLLVEDGVDFLRLDDSAKFELLKFEDFENLPNIDKGRLIAVRDVNEKTKFNAGNNVVKEIVKGFEHYTSVIKGKVLIIADSLHIFPTGVDGRIEIKVSDDRMSAYLDFIPAGGDGRGPNSAQVMAELRKQNIVYGIDNNSISEAINTANKEKTGQEKILIASGTNPKNGEDGQIEYNFDLNGQKADYRILPDGTLDLKNSRNINWVKNGDLLARIIPETPGEQGFDVFGKSLPAEPGRKTVLKAGNGVKATEDGLEFYAFVDGTIIFKDNVLEVRKIQILNGDVDQSTGSLDHNGTMIITGNIHEGFTVKATGNIVVKRNVGPSRLVAGNDIDIAGGIDGKPDRGFVSAGGRICAEYAKDMRLEAGGDIIIDNYLSNSNIFTCGRLIMLSRRGSLSGGQIFAQNGIDVKILGSENNGHTIVEAGVDFLKRKKIEEMDLMLEKLSENLKKLTMILEPILKMMKTNPATLETKMDIIKKTMAKKREIEERQKLISAKRMEFSANVNIDKVCYVKVSSKVFPGVQIKIGRAEVTVRKLLKRIKFSEDAKSGRIRTEPY
ncbi:MAG: FapA family protein [bacterium]